MQEYEVRFYVGCHVAYLTSDETSRVAQRLRQDDELTIEEALRGIIPYTHIFDKWLNERTAEDAVRTTTAILARAQRVIVDRRYDREFDLGEFHEIWREMSAYFFIMSAEDSEPEVLRRIRVPYLASIPVGSWRHIVLSILDGLDKDTQNSLWEHFALHGGPKFE